MYGLANILGNFIASKLNFDQERREVIIYGAFVFMHNLAIVLIVLLVAFIAGIFKETVIIILAFGLLRRFGGGIHVSSPLFCMVSSIIVFPLLGILAAVFSGYLLNVALFGRFVFFLLISSAALICVLFYAPREHPNHPFSTRMRVRLRALSLVISLICTGFLLLGVLWGSFLKEATAVGMALIFQALNLLPAGGWFMDKLDKAFSHFFQKEAKSP
ncbi:MAG TPA: accessory gene regulator B family protein [Firmicutes bacterium]|jgi:accessory gene regulator B|nr:accessory gene regulator B family protein [Bacillota bacterium]